MNDSPLSAPRPDAILSRALAISGATDAITENLAYAAHRVSLHIAALSALGAVLSAFMNNVGTLGLLMPAALRSAAKEKRSPSEVSRAVQTS